MALSTSVSLLLSRLYANRLASADWQQKRADHPEKVLLVSLSPRLTRREALRDRVQAGATVIAPPPPAAVSGRRSTYPRSIMYSRGLDSEVGGSAGSPH